MDTLKSLLLPSGGGFGNGYHGGGYGGSNLIDGMKLVVLGGTVETARRISSATWSHFVNSFFLTAHFDEDEPPYDWLMLWLSRRPEWQRSREMETTTRITTPGGFKTKGIGEFGDEIDPDAPHTDEDAAHPKTRVVFQPTFDTTHTIYWRGHWLRVKRTRRPDRYGYSDNETLSISVVARNNSILKQLVVRAKREYEAEAIHRIQIYFADQYGGWRWTDSRHKRPLNSIVLNPGVKEMLLNDAKDFLASEKWYADRGIPFRRGYLLHGVPGSGKSSLIHALAGELQLDIFVVSLSSSWISDATLTTLMGRVPSRCIVLLEDLDAAFTRSLTREQKDKKKRRKEKKKKKDEKNGDNNNDGNAEGPSPPPRRRNKSGEAMSDQNTLTLSGLLNALDGVVATEGRVLFATTNHLTKLDPALSRPGRMDVWVEFKNASRWQAEALFRNFFPVDEDGGKEEREKEEMELKDAGVVLPDVDPSASDGIPDTKGKARQSVHVASDHDTQGSIWNKLSTPVSLVSDLLSGGSSGNPTISVDQSEVKPPALVYTSSTSAATPSSLSTSPISSPRSDAPSSPTLHSRTNSFSGFDLSALPQFGASNESHPPPPIEREILESLKQVKCWDRETLTKLAKVFADSIPEGEFSVASLQGYLLKYKSKPHTAAHEAAAWVESEREIKAKLEKKKKDREERKKRRKEKKRAQRKLEKLKAKEKEAAEKAAAEAQPPSAGDVAPPLPADASLPPSPANNSSTSPTPSDAPEDSIVIVQDSSPPPPPPPQGESPIIVLPSDLPPPPPIPLSAPPPAPSKAEAKKVSTKRDNESSDSESDDSSNSEDDEDDDDDDDDDSEDAGDEKDDEDSCDSDSDSDSEDEKVQPATLTIHQEPEHGTDIVAFNSDDICDDASNWLTLDGDIVRDPAFFSSHASHALQWWSPE